MARLVRIAHVLRMRGKLEEAVRLCRQATALDPLSVMARSLLSELLQEQGDLVGAVEQVAATTGLAEQAQGVRGALEHARLTRAEIEATVVQRVLGPEERQPWSLARLFFARKAKRRASREFNLVLAALGVIGHLIALVAAVRLDPLGFVWFAFAGFCAYCAWREARARVGSERFWLGLALVTGPPGLVIYFLNHE